MRAARCVNRTSIRRELWPTLGGSRHYFFKHGLINQSRGKTTCPWLGLFFSCEVIFPISRTTSCLWRVTFFLSRLIPSIARGTSCRSRFTFPIARETSFLSRSIFRISLGKVFSSRGTSCLSRVIFFLSRPIFPISRVTFRASRVISSLARSQNRLLAATTRRAADFHSVLSSSRSAFRSRAPWRPNRTTPHETRLNTWSSERGGTRESFERDSARWSGDVHLCLRFRASTRPGTRAAGTCSPPPNS